jgi:probable rRNA maturation factor
MTKPTVQVDLYHFPPSVRALLDRAVRDTIRAERGRGAAVTLVLVADPEIKRLNRRFRTVNRITDVISFSFDRQPLRGDIYIARTRSQKQARRVGHAWERELAYLVIHGVLHLFGYTDYTPRARRKMFLRQDAIFQCLFS